MQKGHVGPVGCSRLLVQVDDVTLAGIDANEADLELLRKVLDRKVGAEGSSTSLQDLAEICHGNAVEPHWGCSSLLSPAAHA